MTAGGRSAAKRYLAGVAVSALLLFLVLRQVDSGELLASVQQLGIAPLGFAVVGMLFCFLMGTVRLTTALSRISGILIPVSEVLGRWFPMTLGTVLLAHVISVAGDVIRLPRMVRRHGLHLSTSIALLAFDRVVGFGFALLLSALSSAAVLWPELSARYAVEFVLLVLLALLLLALVLLTVRAVRRLAGGAFIRTLVGTYFGSLRRVLEQVAIALLACAGIAIAIAVVASAIGANVPAGIALAAAPLVYCGASIPFTFAGWGSREASMIAALSWSGWTSPTDAILVSLAIGLASLIASLPGAGFLWLSLSSAERRASPSGGP